MPSYLVSPRQRRCRSSGYKGEIKDKLSRMMIRKIRTKNNTFNILNTGRHGIITENVVNPRGVRTISRLISEDVALT